MIPTYKEDKEYFRKCITSYIDILLTYKNSKLMVISDGDDNSNDYLKQVFIDVF